MHESVVTPARMLLPEAYASLVFRSFLLGCEQVYHNHLTKGKGKNEGF